MTANVRSSTKTLTTRIRVHLAWSATTRSNMRTLSSDVAKPEPAVMPLVALISLEYTPSTPTVLRNL